MPPKRRPHWTAGATVVCKHNNTLWKSKIIDVKEAETNDPIYLVHYQGWNSRYDEEVRHSESSQKIFEANEENLAAAIESQKVSKGPPPKRSRLDNLADDDFRTSENGSRGSSPSVSSLKDKSFKRKTDMLGDHDLSGKSTIEINISLPKSLRQILVDDQDMINKNNIVKLPARYTVEDIIDEYIETVKGEKKEDSQQNVEKHLEYDNESSQLSETSLICSARGLIDYFNPLLNIQLMYKFERPQYQEIAEKEKSQKEKPKKRKSALASEANDEFKPSKHYGLPHLLRLLTRLPTVLKLTAWDDHLLKQIVQSVHDFIVFLNKNHEKYFDATLDYIPAPPEYPRSFIQM